MGHNNLNTTQIYMDYFDDERKKEFSESEKNITKKIEELSNELKKLRTVIKI